jgi:hypothetical protein
MGCLFFERGRQTPSSSCPTTMSIYTARLLKGNQKPNPDFKQKGIATLQPCALGNSDIRGYPHRKQIAYSAYVQSLSAFLFATEKQERVSTSADGFLISLPFDKTLEHILPTLGVAFTKKITKDVLQAWEREYGVRVKENQGQTIYMFDEPTYELAKVMKERPEGAILESRTPLGVSSLAGLQAYLMSWKILTLFAYVLSVFLNPSTQTRAELRIHTQHSQHPCRMKEQSITMLPISSFPIQKCQRVHTTSAVRSYPLRAKTTIWRRTRRIWRY